MGPTMALSAFLNNTPLVAMLIPAVTDWSRTLRMSASRFLLPLSYAAILGGTCTLIGTSTNLVVQGLVVRANLPELPNGLGMFDITWVGLPAALVGGAFMLLACRWLLPERKAALTTQTDPREYTVEMQVAADGPLVGKSIEQAGLRHLPDVFLAEIERQGTAMPAVGPREVLQANDRLLFVGVVESVKDLQRIRGLLPAADQVFKLNTPRPQRCLIEAVVSNSCPIVGKTIRDGRFRNVYNAVVVAVARNGERLRQKVGDVVLAAGDTLLIEAQPSFAEQHRNSRDFFLVSRVENSQPIRHERAWIALGLLLAMVATATAGWISMLEGSLVVAGLMVATRCVSLRAARRSVEWDTLLAIAASFALGTALETTDAARSITVQMLSLAGGNPWVTLAMIYLVTLIVTELITNNAAAALMFPFALAAARNLDVNVMPFIAVVMMAASAGFATPIGYQTNLMVYGPGGYRFSDYVKLGVPLDILVGVVTVGLAPLVWPFR
jgi:di/tricarboxylate transporter